MTLRRTLLSYAAAFFLGVVFHVGGAQPGLCQGAPAPAQKTELLEKAQAIHETTFVLDAHADIVLPTTSKTYLGADGLSKVDPPKLKTGGFGAVVMAVAVGPGPRTPKADAAARLEAEQKLAAVRTLAEEHADKVAIATSVEDVMSTRNAGKVALILGYQNARSLEGTINALDRFYQAGVRVFALNHLGHNDFADSSRPAFDGKTRTYEPEEEHGGLSPLGRAAVERINRLGGVVDVSQSSKAATLQMIALSKTPVIASHSNVRKLSNVTRNLSDEEIDRIGETGGVIHMAAFAAYLVDLSDPDLLAKIRKVRKDAGLPEAYSYPYELYWEIPDPEKRLAFLTSMRDVIGRSSVARMVDHIDYIVTRIGIDHVGIGSDFNHGGGVGGFNDASEAMNVTLELTRRGYSADDIGKIWSGNFLRVMRTAEAVASDMRSSSD